MGKKRSFSSFIFFFLKKGKRKGDAKTFSSFFSFLEEERRMEKWRRR
jgi:hypothetical protein